MVYNVPNAIDFLQNNWGDLASALGLAASVLGLMASLGGLVWAIKARRAAVAAESAAAEAADSIGRAMSVVDLRKAIDLIQRLKDLHRENRWEAALEHYQPLREMIYWIQSRYPDWDESDLEKMIECRVQITLIEGMSGSFISNTENVQQDDIATMNELLNEIQEFLEELAGEAGFGMS